MERAITLKNVEPKSALPARTGEFTLYHSLTLALMIAAAATNDSVNVMEAVRELNLGDTLGIAEPTR